jgi:D-tyrosyl-tRNA(Tyr) deacylase
MIALLQRVLNAQVKVKGEIVSQINSGILLFLGIEKNDDKSHCDKMLHKVLNYRIFADKDDKMNLSLIDTQKELLVVSQFTLAADTNSGMRPSFSSAKNPTVAENLYNYFTDESQKQINTQTGVFAADMQISLINDGPVSFILNV